MAANVPADLGMKKGAQYPHQFVVTPEQFRRMRKMKGEVIQQPPPQPPQQLPQPQKIQPTPDQKRPKIQNPIEPADEHPIPIKNEIQHSVEEVFKSVVQLAPYFDNMTDVMFLTKNTGIITDALNNFRNLDKFDIPDILKHIGDSSGGVNGFINKISLKKVIDIYAFEFNIILKSIKTHADGVLSDNLGYEYFVGAQCVNEFARMYPMFIKTYGFFRYKSLDSYKKFAAGGSIGNKLYTDYIDYVDLSKETIDRYADIVQKNPLFIAITSEFIPSNSDVKTFLTQKISQTRTVPEYFYRSWIKLVGLLYMVYMPLGNLAKNFTHYDLHNQNVLLYKKKAVARHGIPNDIFKVTVKNFKTGSIECTFKTDALPVIIDYGRSWISCNNMVNVPDIPPESQTLLIPKHSTPEYTKIICNKDNDVSTGNCGSNSGHAFMYDPGTTANLTQAMITYGWTATNKKNESHDLRLLVGAAKATAGIILPTNISSGTNPSLVRGIYTSFWSVINTYSPHLYTLWIKLIDDLEYAQRGGTPERFIPDKISTVRQASDRLREIIQHPDYQKAVDGEYVGTSAPTFELIMYNNGYNPFECNPLR